MTFLLLTGAGFSRNWGGWLANEAFEYLLGCSEIDEHLKNQLWRSKESGGGFEDALAHLQEEYNRQKDARTEKPLRSLQAAIAGMFNDMDQGFSRKVFEPQHDMNQLVTDANYTVQNFLVRFDAIFTLNQDLLLERYYLSQGVSLSSSQKWNDANIPGVKPLNATGINDPALAKISPRTPDPSNFNISPRIQPYLKLHGSSNWFDDTGAKLLIMGGNKAVEIRQYPLLSWYHEKFQEYLSRPDVQLMVIGYSFGDHHINEAIVKAADKVSLRLFIVDPQGVDVLDKQNPRAPIRVRSPLMEKLEPRIVGASRRPLTAIFGNDRVEHGKVMRFFAR